MTDEVRKRPPGPGRGNRTKIGNGTGSGPGWGGPAKGAGTGKPSRPHGKEGLAVKAALPADVKQAKAERKEATRETMLAVYERVAEDITAPHMAQVMAADKWLDRHEGKPLQSHSHRGAVGVVPLPLDPSALTDDQREFMRDILLIAPPTTEEE